MKYKILVVDDDKELVKMLCSYFNMKQYETITATDGMEALNKIKMKPDIILLDINMPRMDGIEVCRLIRSKVLCPILFLTARVWSICSVILCTLLRNMWAGIGCLFGIVIGLISKAGSSFFGNLGLFSFSFCEPTQLMSESWIYGTLVSFIAGLFLFAVLPMALKKRG